MAFFEDQLDKNQQKENQPSEQPAQRELSDITFKVDEQQKITFGLVLRALGMTKEEAFDALLSMLVAKALGEEGAAAPRAPIHSHIFAPSEMAFTAKSESKRLSPDVIRSRIERWAERIHSYPYLMLRAYFETERTFADSEGVILGKMMRRFNHLAGLPAEDSGKFTSIFRQMCSASPTSYGNVFVYNRRAGTVHLNSDYEELIRSLCGKFLPDEY